MHDAEYASIKLVSRIPEFSETLKEQIGNRPVITMKIDVNGNEIRWNNRNITIRAAIPYHPTVEESADFEYIIVWHIDTEEM